MDDDQLMADFYAGKPGAEQELEKRYWSHLLGYLMGSLRIQLSDAEDAVQNTLLKVERTRRTQSNRYQPGSNTSLRAWLRTIAFREAISLLRPRKKMRFVGSAEELPAEDIRARGEKEPLEYAAAGELGKAIQNCLENLATNHREVLEMRMQGLGNPEIAESLQLPYGTVGQRVFHAHQQMRDCLQGKGHSID